MRKFSSRMTRGLSVVFVALLGSMALTANPAAAQAVKCVIRAPDQNLMREFDPNDDGTLTRTELLLLSTDVASDPRYTQAEKDDLIAQYDVLIAELDAAQVAGFQYDGVGSCAPATATNVPATNVPATTVPATSAATTMPATSAATTVPATSAATTVPATSVSTTVPATSVSTTTPGTMTATTVPGTVIATSTSVPRTSAVTPAPGTTATAAPGGDDSGSGDDDATVVSLPETGQGPDAGQGNATVVILLGGMSLLIAVAFFVTSAARRT